LASYDDVAQQLAVERVRQERVRTQQLRWRLREEQLLGMLFLVVLLADRVG